MTKEIECKLLKVLYGLRQAPKLWYKRLFRFLLEKLGLQRINVNYSIFISSAKINRPIVSTFMNDIKIIEVKDFGVITRVKRELTAAFKMADMGSISLYLCLKVTPD